MLCGHHVALIIPLFCSSVFLTWCDRRETARSLGAVRSVVCATDAPLLDTASENLTPCTLLVAAAFICPESVPRFTTPQARRGCWRSPHVTDLLQTHCADPEKQDTLPPHATYPAQQRTPTHVSIYVSASSWAQGQGTSSTHKTLRTHTGETATAVTAVRKSSNGACVGWGRGAETCDSC